MCPPPKDKSSSMTAYSAPFTLYYPLTPFPSGNYHIVVCLYEFPFVCFSCLFIGCFQFYIPHMCEIICSFFGLIYFA